MAYTPPKYPSEIPTIGDLPDRTDDVDWLYAARYNELKKELRAIMIELGITPSGAYDTVKARLDAGVAADKIFEGDSSVEVIDTDGDGHVDIKTENVLCGKYNSDGILDLPKQSSIRAFKSASPQTIDPTTWTKIVLDGENYDIQNEFDPVTNYRFTATKAGLYLIHGQMNWGSAEDQKVFYATIRKNGAGIFEKYTPASGADSYGMDVTSIVSLEANDYIEFYTYHGCVASKAINKGTYSTFLNIHKLS